MSQFVAPPSANAEKPKARRAAPPLFERSERRGVQIAIIATILVHLLMLIMVPRVFNAAAGHAPTGPRAPRTFTVQVVPPPPRPKVPLKPQLKFVEANPNAPENVPDKTNNFSDRNQQVAQEKPTPNGKNDMPALSGRKDVQSNQIVSGSLNKPAPDAPVPPEATTPTPPKVATPKREQTPLAGTVKDEGKDPNGFGTNVAKLSPLAQDVPRKIDGTSDAPLTQSADVTTPRIDPTHPRPRKTLDIHARPAIFKDNQFGTSNIGPIAVDARWSNYGVYLRRLTETVQIEWDNIITASGVYPQSGSTVEVKFRLNSKGEISQILGVKPSAGTSDEATKACVSGITTRAPYGPWTDDMIAILGDDQEMTFVFYYE
jgi:hypothetical protein